MLKGNSYPFIIYLKHSTIEARIQRAGVELSSEVCGWQNGAKKGKGEIGK